MTGFKIGEYKAKQETNKPKEPKKLKLSDKSVFCEVCKQDVWAIYKNDTLAKISCEYNNLATRLCDISSKPCHLYFCDKTKSPPKSFLDKIMLR